MSHVFDKGFWLDNLITVDEMFLNPQLGVNQYVFSFDGLFVN